jgi:hypothetical protein
MQYLQGKWHTLSTNLNPEFNMSMTNQMRVLQGENTCRNLNLGLATKARAYKSVGQKGSPRGTSYTPGSVGKCERMNPHTPK